MRSPIVQLLRNATSVVPMLVIVACTAKTRHAPPLPQRPGAKLTFSAETRLCSERNAVGDTVRAHLITGGAGLVPSRDSGTGALFVVNAFRMARMSNSEDKPELSLELIAIDASAPSATLNPKFVAYTTRVRADSTDDRWYYCILPGSTLSVGDHAWMRR